MVLTDVPPHVAEDQTLYALITRNVTRVHPWVLATMTVVGGAGGAALLIVRWHWWASSFVLLTSASIAAWGLIEQHAAQPHTRVIRVAEWLLSAAGLLLGFASLFGVMFQIMGPPPGH
jgi:hypothetical protein